ncbi:MAG: hypothetical protein M1834_008763 [Cirrosporium novae-zelandiae]|nr:MAG: hypothetical protein M1834_008763 [Cirrosporium novae-zelandiae]
MSGRRQRHDNDSADAGGLRKQHSSSSSSSVLLRQEKDLIVPTSSSNPSEVRRPSLHAAHSVHGLPTLPGPSGKLAIPRLRRPGEPSTEGQKEKQRVSHACEPCRQRKTKCSGDVPSCRHCQEFNLECYYADGKRDKQKKEFGSMADRLHEYESILQELCNRVDVSDQVLIRNALSKGSTSEITTPSIYGTQIPSSSQESLPSEGEERQAPARIGSTGSLDAITEDFSATEQSRATGFTGKHSERSWMRRLQEQASQGQLGPAVASTEPQLVSSTPSPAQVPAFHRTSSEESLYAKGPNYNTDDIEIEIPDEVDPYDIPSRDVAVNLFSSYLETVQATFPVIGKIDFIRQFYRFIDRPSTEPGTKWLAILNLIFAIGAKYLQVTTQLRDPEDKRGHQIYFKRARMLALTGHSLLKHPDLQQIQITALMSFYLLTVNQINRAWHFSGLAVRYAISLGLHKRNDNPSIKPHRKEIRYRLWWSLYALERTVNIITGRPTAIMDLDCAVPFPVPFEEETFFPDAKGQIKRDIRNNIDPKSSSSFNQYPEGLSTSVRPTRKPGPSHSSKIRSISPLRLYAWTVEPNPSLAFVFQVRLCMIAHETMRDIYSADVMNHFWSDVQSAIRELSERLEEWKKAVPPALQIAGPQHGEHNAQMFRLKMGLALFYYSMKMIINRPCLCQISPRMPHESRKSREFNLAAAVNCVRAAQGLIDILPDVPDAALLYKASPWWNILEYLVQAATVLMLELSSGASHLPNETDDLLNTAKKAVLWLHSLTRENLAATRAWKMSADMLRLVAHKIGQEIHNMPERPLSDEGLSQCEQTNPTPGVFPDVDAEQHNRNMPSLKLNPSGVEIPEFIFFGGSQGFEPYSFHHPIYTIYDNWMPYSYFPSGQGNIMHPPPIGMDIDDGNLDELMD